MEFVEVELGAMMSFFFVRSGFVATYSHKSEDPNYQYLSKRLKKTYPFFLLMWLLGLPACIVNIYFGKRGTCIEQRWIYLLLQPLCLETFLGWEIDVSNNPGWFYTSLVVVWALYSRIHVHKWIGNHAYNWILGLYVASLLASYPFFIFDGASVQQMPLLHTFEFFMGCSAAISFKQGHAIRGEVPALRFIISLAYSGCTVQLPEIWDHAVIYTEQTCDFWQQRAQYSTKAGNLVTVTSIVSVVIIHWLACSESRGGSYIANKILGLDISKSLTKFSLQLYLSHAVTSVGLEYTLKGLNILHWFSKDYHVLFAYGTSFALYVYVQLKLDLLLTTEKKCNAADQQEVSN